VLAPLGQGGHGVVHQAVRLGGGETVAIKLVNPVARSLPLSARLLRQEIALCATLLHPCIPALRDSGETAAGLPFAVFDLVPGLSLQTHLRRHGPMRPAAAAALLDPLLDALAYLHDRGVVHCDVKPGNILLTPSGQARLIDFGSATPAPQRLCSPAYSPPEQLRGDAPTPKFDLYAWAAVLLECLGGRAEPAGGDPRGPDMSLPWLDGHPLGALLRQLLREDPGRRPGDARLLRRRLRLLDLHDLSNPDDPARLTRPSGADARDLATTQAPPSSPVMR
jgi:serine/threonine protein kinase